MTLNTSEKFALGHGAIFFQKLLGYGPSCSTTQVQGLASFGQDLRKRTSVENDSDTGTAIFY